MRNPETQNAEELDPSRWIKYRYRGNFSNSVSLNDTLLREVIQITKPEKVLLITDGTEGPERTTYGLGRKLLEIIPSQEIKLSRTLRETSTSIVLSINSRVIDGRLQETQRKKKQTQEWYKLSFENYLISLVTEAIRKWAVRSIHDKPDSSLNKKDKARKMNELRDFWIKNGGKLVFKSGESAPQEK